ncbi:MAG TPA: hypothetical protein VMU36_04740 [Spirochaetia bacterium]|nr:hypothetical protein [Spirochaetia bacterium]
MAIEPVSSYVSGVAQFRPPEPAPDARVAVDQENDARRIAEADRGASPQYLTGPGPGAQPAGGGRVDAGAVVNDPEGSIQRAQTLIESSSANAAPSSAEVSRAADAYRAVANAQSDIARQKQGEGTRTTDVLA